LFSLGRWMISNTILTMNNYYIKSSILSFLSGWSAVGALVGALGFRMFFDGRDGVCNEIIQAESPTIKWDYGITYL